MEQNKKIKAFFEEQSLYAWCLEQASDRYRGELAQEKIDKLDSIGFPWAYYENELDKLGYHWKKNNPNGVRYKDLEAMDDAVRVNDYLDREKENGRAD